MKHRDTRGTEEEHNRISEQIIGGAIEVHRTLGPGLYESVYEECLAHELTGRGLRFRRQVALPLIYKGIRLDGGYRLDLLVENKVVVEVKAVEHLLPVHEVQILTYLRLTGAWLGLLINFHVATLHRGVRRVVN